VRAVRIAALTLALLGAPACDEGRDVVAPGQGDFVEIVVPGNGETLTADKFGDRPVTLVLDFFAAEGQFGFGSLLAFRFDGADVRESVQLLPEGGPPPNQVTIIFEPGTIEAGGHDVEVEYADSRGVIHSVGWSFTIEG